MEGGLVKKMIVVTMMMLISSNSCAFGRLVKVGGKALWKPGFNYTLWAAHQHFYVGDWLYFIFDKRLYNVLEVNKSSYVHCNDHQFITNITRGGRDVFNLTQARPYYFISSGGYCFNGMKLAIHVLQPPPPSPPPASSLRTSSDSPPQLAGGSRAQLLVTNAVLLVFILNFIWRLLW